MDKIVTVENKKDERFLRKKTAEFDFKKFSRREIQELIIGMRKAMRQARGIGLSANQIGLDMRVFVAQIPQTRISADTDADKGVSRASVNQHSYHRESAFYAVFNPEIMKYSRETVPMEEGCLSVPGVYGLVDRPEKVVLAGFDKNGKPLKIKAWGLLAKVFQHEMDHLNGKLFIDKAKEIYRMPVSERLKKKSGA
ncbi:MAG: peptide deformylase [Candidatus Liptonbacteria bacterium]|nr:peptide deformylase [Candidatus Liptonbacteria bacterium]